ncbi:DUF1775 domain-containing protein [Phenylobacterium sp.]|jgi:predicted lipoprotein with Yx(FWY)xxD motif|uniref:DUF1775 domain-containing protein n=1 Tax=Phenylobacterium sp. TaxID=1871053 RepID=UPI002E2FA56B|nr:DUF1775 domain-containing protein [Phenylobacterium sp.]HEX3367501.1 DUF1775 domain-containing protein [Phenylobacterium sp.]
MTRFLAPAFALALVSGAAQAHVTVQPTTAAPGGEETLRFVVGHGCDGQPTTALRVELPAGLSKAQPQPKDGWTLATERLPGGGGAFTWRGELPPHQADGFAVRAKLPKTSGPLSFVAAQTCGATTVRWDEPTPTGGPRPTHPAPTLMLTAASEAVATAPAAGERLPNGVQRLADGGLADAAGRPLYTFDFDTMVGMSHCDDECARMWPPLAAAKGEQPFGDWSLISRPQGAAQWAYKARPLYAYSQDRPGEPARGTQAPNWKRAK